MTINTDKLAPRVEVDNWIPLRNYYRIADSLLRQASIYREENNVVELYIIFLRYLSLASETIPYHRDYQHVHPKEKNSYMKRSFAIINEVESLKPDYQRHVEKQRFGSTSNSSRSAYLSTDVNQPAVAVPQSSWRYSSSSQIDKQLNKLYVVVMPG